jgi:predicted ester cyclase
VSAVIFVARHKDIYCRVIEAVSAGDPSALDDLLHPAMVDHNPMPNQPPGRGGFQAWMAAVRSSFPDFRGAVQRVLEEGDLVAGRVIWRGTQRGPFLGLPATDRPVSVEAFHIVRFSDEFIVEWWGTADLLGAAQQLDAQVVPSRQA